MKNRMYRQMQICACSGKRTSSSGCCCSMHILNSEKRIKVHIINIYNERERHEKNSIYNSIDFRAAA